MVIMLYNDFNIKILPKPMNNNIIKGGNLLIKQYIERKEYQKHQQFLSQLKIIFLE